MDDAILLCNDEKIMIWMQADPSNYLCSSQFLKKIN
jgi:hypothetical protein